MAAEGSALQHDRRAPLARWSRLLALGSLVGVAGGLAAAALHWGLEMGSELVLRRFVGANIDTGGVEVLVFDWYVLLLPAFGGLMSGVVVQLLFRESTGHGTDLLTRAFHSGLGVFPLRGPLIKSVAAVGVISCGGSAGPEGPIAALGAALGSSTGQLLGLSPREKRILLIAGCAAGVGAIFGCPLGGALFATSVPYRDPEFESDAMVPAFFASVLGYSTFISFIPGSQGARLLGDLPALGFSHVSELLPYILLGVLCGLFSIFFASILHATERGFSRLTRIPLWFRPALGGLATGVVACALPQVMDGQYTLTRVALDLDLHAVGAGFLGAWRWPLFFAGVAVAKCLATSLTVGSGASGGVLGPSVFVGGMVGALLASFLGATGSGDFAEPLRQALVPVGMAGVLAGSMRTPLAAIVMVTEMTGSYGLIVPLMVVCMSAYVIARRHGLNREQLRTSADSPAHAADGLIHILESWRVGDLMEETSLCVEPRTPLGEMVKMVKPATRPVFAVVDRGLLVGVVSLPDIERVVGDSDSGLLAAVIAADIMTTQVTTVTPEDDAYEVLNRFRATRHDVLPVVADPRRPRWLGMLSRRAIFDALRERTDTIHRMVLEEHAGLLAIDEEGRISEIAMAVAPNSRDLIQRRMVPADALGRSLRETDFRRVYGVTVLGVEHADGTLQFPPDLDMPLDAEHRLIVTAHAAKKQE
jgi:chloride channel protein, CIC family